MGVAAILKRFAGPDSMSAGRNAGVAMGGNLPGGDSLAKAANKSGSAVNKLVANIVDLGASATKATGLVGGFVSGLVKSLTDPLDMLKAFAGPISELVALANPNVVKQFTLAMNDAMAVFGQIATPILKGMTMWVKSFGDAWAKMVPVLLPLTEKLGQMFADMGYLGARLIEAWSPVIELFVDVMVPVAQQLGRALAYVNGFMVELIKTITALLGIKSERRDERATSRGAAVRNANVSSVEGYARDLFAMQAKNLFGGQKTKDPVQVQQEILDAIKAGQDTFVAIKEGIQSIYEFLKGSIEEIKSRSSSITDTGKKVVNTVGSIGLGGVATNGSAGLGVGGAVGSLVGLLGRAILK